MSKSKENGGLLASIGLKNKDFAYEEASMDGDSEGAPHNKSDLFDTSKDRIAKKEGAKTKDAKGKDSDEDFDLGFNSGKKQPAQGKKDAAPDAQKKSSSGKHGFEDKQEEMTEEQQRKEIEEQFKLIYEEDPELQKALEKSDVANFTIEEKY